MSARELITDHLDLWTSAVTHKSGSGRSASGKNGKIELTGIKKLRELILELAVRGKLVEQDPSDEPASELLDRIAEEKTRLVKEGKIRRAKSQPAVELEEVDFELPSSWLWVRLGSVGQVVGGGTPKSGEPSFWSEKEIAWLTPADLYGLNEKYISSGKRDISRLGLEKSSAQLLPEGAVLFSSRAPIGYVAIAAKELATNQGFKSCAPYIRDVSQFVYYFLKRSARHIDASASGTTFKEVSGSKFASIPMPLPPLEEQHRIVEKVDELMALCDRLERQVGDQLEAHEVLVDTLLDALTRSSDATELAENWARVSEHFDTLFTTEASIDKLKKTILQLAVMGRLVQQDPNDEPAIVLLDKIAEEKARLVKEGKIKKPKKSSDPQAEKIPFHVPKNWQWCRLESLALHSESGWSPQCNNTPRSGDRWGVLKVSAVSWGSFNPDENKALPDNLTPRTELEVKPNDFLITRANTAELVARSTVVPEGAPQHLMMSDKIVRLVFSMQASTLYINLFNNCKIARDYYSQVAGGTSSSMKNVSRKQIHELLIPLPPAEEQHRIVEKVDELMALCDRLKARLSEAGKTRSQLAETLVEQTIS
ncbi:restriction endonuclease subunit S [Chromohalobacter israelensis]|uniref:restriction endonuclease subunit S n=1 Tax=Chromohalobacter israelensis TaxID=141390 RepID=UPI00265C5B7C|nr:restriction endonuclease subunit S [Chromohalobacter salexigens]MDO0944509.1 restriction endonuclease subunit S [Chromohalobacter salexigens]